jgi:hypothetical protein
LHWKADSTTIIDSDLNKIYGDICGSARKSSNGVKPVVDIIKAEAESCLKSGSDSLESKIVLAIAIRLAAESFMVNKINDPKFAAGIKGHQTEVLVTKFKGLFPKEAKTIEVLDRVQLMTPENIHLNSFMYEPIVDMAGDHLRKLYTHVLALK